SGKMNYMTPEIEARTGQQEQAAEQPQEQAASESRLAGAVSFDKVSIENGNFTYFDHASGCEAIISDIDMVLRAETLQGPYKFEGDLGYNGYEIALEGGMGRYSADTKSIVPQVEALINPGKIGVIYSG